MSSLFIEKINYDCYINYALYIHYSFIYYFNYSIVFSLVNYIYTYFYLFKGQVSIELASSSNSAKKESLISNSEENPINPNNINNLSEKPVQQVINIDESKVNYDQTNINNEHLVNDNLYNKNQNVNYIPYCNLGGAPTLGVNNMPYQNTNDILMTNILQNFNN